MDAPTFAGASSRPLFEAQCTHLTMTRLYNSELVCEVCQRPGSAGWLYQCVQDQEDFIEHLGLSGKLNRMDDISLGFIAQMDIRKGSAADRDRPFSLLDELTPEQMSQYSAKQMGILLKQRENVRSVIQEEMLRFNHAVMMRHFESEGMLIPAPYDCRKPWHGGSYQECRYLVCSRCRPGCALRATLSLDAVANGEIPPTAATGYGFHNTGGRPVMDAQVVSNLGSRPVPAVRLCPPRRIFRVHVDHKGRGEKLTQGQKLNVLPHIRRRPKPKSGTSPCVTSVASLDLLESQNTGCVPVRGQDLMKAWDNVVPLGSGERLNWPTMPEDPLFSPGNLKRSPRCVNLDLHAEPASKTDSSKPPPLIWTPPPTPLCVSAGLPDGSLSKLGPPLPNIADVINHSRVRQVSLDKATDEDPNARNDSSFTPSPLKVGHGVAVLEESIQLGVPDVITQAA